MRIYLFLYFILTTGGMAYSQVTNLESYDLRNPGKDLDKKCSELFTVRRMVPEDARFSIFIRRDSVLMAHSDEGWFWKLIPDRNDGIAVDLISEDIYKCDQVNNPSSNWSHKGFLLPPLYREDLKKNIIPVQKGYIGFFVGKVPAALKSANLEMNYLIAENKYVCHYTNIVHVDYHGWELLRNGLYYDTLTSENLQQRYKDISKTLHFTIPFEKDKAEYKESDIRPLYDSLNLTDYEIKAIRIHTYTSVEGSAQRNQKLQVLRAESIVKALQSFQPEKLQSSITSSENWVEFLEDINGSVFRNLTELSKGEIKEKLKSSEILEKMEPVLRNHRKAVIELDLEKRVLYLKSSGEQLKKYFDQQLSAKNIEEALYLQQIIFYKIQKHDLPDYFIEELEVPDAIEFGSLLINDAAYRFENYSYDVFEGIRTFEKLNTLLKNNPKIKYNLCALKLTAWRSAPGLIDNAALKKDIELLRKVGIPDQLVRRLTINYQIIASEVYLQNKKYLEKDKSVKFIYDTYGPLALKDEDLVNLAKYFSYNSRFDWAERILAPRMKSIDVSEDALFYYLNLTIYKRKNIKNSSYRTIMLNAVNANQERFCTLFNSIKNGGVSFQLLDDAYLKKTYCENCNSSAPLEK